MLLMPNDVYSKVSIIIPVADDETDLPALLGDLDNCGAEIIISSEGSRAASLNVGAQKATHEILWFLHADSRVSNENMISLKKVISGSHDCLFYFDLEFMGGGMPSLNAWGANMRSRLLGVPFGDQGFCVSRKVFDRVGGYPDDVPYGEDLMFVWRARQAGVRLMRVSSRLQTSARKYQMHGWLKLTLLYQWRWVAMSVPQVLKLWGVRK